MIVFYKRKYIYWVCMIIIDHLFKDVIIIHE